MEENSSLYLVEEDVDINIEEEALALFAKTTDVLFSMSHYARNLNAYYKALEERVGKRNFKKILENIDNGQKGVIVNSSNYVKKEMECVKKMMYSNKIEK